jgi:hypothetical protein
MSSIAYPRGILSTHDAERFTAMNPCIRRLNRQLRVDFASDVRAGSEEKRKREPTRSIYEEAAANLAKDTQEKALKKRARRLNKRIRMKQQRRAWPAKKTEPEDQHLRMMHAAASLAQMSGSGHAAAAHEKLNAAEKTIGRITKAHSDALLAAKDEAIRAATAALAAKEELVRVQATLINLMQQNAGPIVV